MPNINILGASHQKRESADFYMLREKGQPAINFIHFTSPVVIAIDQVEHVTEKNACILYSPGARQEYRANGESFRNDYITFQIDDADFLEQFDLPRNRIFYINEAEKVTEQLEWIAWAAADKTEPHGADIYEAIVKLFATIEKNQKKETPIFNRLAETKQRFLVLREEMKKNPAKWNVEKMAQSVWLTRSRFSVVYHDFFGVSPNADLINFKMDLAKKLLETTNKQVPTIAKICGYSSCEHFIRIFSKTTGTTPLKHRKLFQENLRNSK